MRILVLIHISPWFSKWLEDACIVVAVYKDIGGLPHLPVEVMAVEAGTSPQAFTSENLVESNRPVGDREIPLVIRDPLSEHVRLGEIGWVVPRPLILVSRDDSHCECLGESHPAFRCYLLELLAELLCEIG